MELENVAEIEVEIQESGPAGEQGPPGLSAYEVYLVNGGTLSEKEWLESLKGETGQEGYTPVKGEDYFTEEDIASLKIPTKTSQLENDSDFTTNAYVDEAVGTLSNSVNEQIANIDIPEPNVPEYILEASYTEFVNSSGDNVHQKVEVLRPDEQTFNNVKAIFADVVEKDIRVFNIRFKNINDNKDHCLLTCETGGHPAYSGTNYVTFSGVLSKSSLSNIVMLTLSITFMDGGTNPPTSMNWYRYTTLGYSDSRFRSALNNYGLSKTNATEFTPTSDYHPATKKYVDDTVTTLGDYVDEQLANIGGSELEVYDLEIHFSTSSLGAISSSEGKTNLQALVNHAYQVKTPIAVNIIYSSSAEKQSPELFYVVEENTLYTIQDAYNSDTEIKINGSWTDGVFEISSASRHYKTYGNYLSKTNTTSYTPTSNYHPATKQYVDNVAASAGEKRYIYLTGGYDIETGYSNDYPYFNTDDLAIISEYVTKYYKDSYIDLLPLTIINNKNNQSGVKGLAQVITIHNVYEEFGTIFLNGIAYIPNSVQINGCFDEIHGIGIMLISNTWTDGVFTCTRGGFRNEDIGGYLSKTNTRSFTPTSDYHPATKKYVDDKITSSISTAITTVLEGEY